jgi:polar amino acid transport system substrate-binding protein
MNQRDALPGTRSSQNILFMFRSTKVLGMLKRRNAYALSFTLFAINLLLYTSSAYAASIVEKVGKENFRNTNQLYFMFSDKAKRDMAKDENGHWRGIKGKGKRAFQIEIARAVMEKVGYSKTVKLVPFKRGLYYVQHLNNMAMVNASRLPSREGTVQWVGPTHSLPNSMYQLKNPDFQPSSLKDYSDKSVCIHIGSEEESIFTKLDFNTIYKVSDPINCLKMLNSGRVFATTFSTGAFRTNIKKLNLDESNFEATVEVFRSNTYLIFSNNVPKTEINKWQRALDEIKGTDQYQKLRDDYYFGL